MAKPTGEGLSVKCPRCGKELWKKRAGQWTLDNRIVKLSATGAFQAKCPDCREDVPVPFLMIDPTAPRPATPGVRMVVRVVP